MLKYIVIAAIVGVLVANYLNLDELIPGPIVETKNGPVQGIISKTRDGKDMYVYFGIPYAKPPIQNLRYESPQPIETKWTEVYDASALKSECLQINLMTRLQQGSEDCLFLNVYTPKPEVSAKLRPTIVWIHGGAFTSGASNMYRGNFFLDEDIVLVTMNYRLAALGFLNTEDGVVRGNMGLKDQTMGLKWVKDNIAKFGGDPNNVVLTGESAGAASVHYHLLSPMSKGLFSKAIVQSGVAVSAWAIRPNPSEQAKRYAKNLNCPTENTKEMVECMKRTSPEELLAGHQESLVTLKSPDTFFTPTVETVKDDDTFVDAHPNQLIKEGRSLDIPVMFGYNSHEGLLTSPSIMRDEEILEKFETNFNHVMADFVMFPSSETNIRESGLTKARDLYFGPGEPINAFEKFENYTNFITDVMWAEGLGRTAKQLQLQKSPAYLYYYTFKGQFSITNLLLALKNKYPVFVEFLVFKVNRWFRRTILGEEFIHYGACHADELALLFKLQGFYDVDITHKDYAMSKKLVKLWTSFAAGKEPLKFQDVEWQPLQKNTKELKYIVLDEKSAMISQPNKERLDFWKTLID